MHEPPRRVLVALPHSKITISDYLFPGEGAQDAQMSLEDMFDITVHNKVDIEDIEGQAGMFYFKNAFILTSHSLPKIKGLRYKLQSSKMTDRRCFEDKFI